MTDQNQLLRASELALEALTCAGSVAEGESLERCAIEALRAALSAPAQPASGEAVAYRETITGRLCEPDDEHRRKFPMCYRPLSYADTTPPASQEQADPWKTEAMGKMSRIEESMTLLADKLEQASQEQAQTSHLGALAKRRIFDAIRGAYDIGYNDARNAKAVPGDGAPGYAGRDAEADHGGALLNSLNKCLKAAQPSGEVVAYRVSSLGEPELGHWFAEDPLLEGYKCEPLYTAPQPAQPAARVAMTDEQRQQVFRDAENRMMKETNLSWRNAVVECVEAHHQIGKAEQ